MGNVCPGKFCQKFNIDYNQSIWWYIWSCLVHQLILNYGQNFPGQTFPNGEKLSMPYIVPDKNSPKSWQLFLGNFCPGNICPHTKKVTIKIEMCDDIKFEFDNKEDKVKTVKLKRKYPSQLETMKDQKSTRKVLLRMKWSK